MEEDEGEHYASRAGETLKKGRYRLKRLLGSGAHSIVWLAEDQKAHRDVAVKLTQSAQYATLAARDEIQMYNTIRSQHRNPARELIVEMLDHFEISGRTGTHVCLVLKAYQTTLRDLLDQHQPHGIPLPLFRQIAKRLLRGVELLHQCGIIHTDIKPENILICSRGASACEISASNGGTIRPDEKISVKIIDFGNAHLVDEDANGLIQTKPYRAPEVLLDQQWSIEVDVWSIACVMCEMLTGSYLFEVNHAFTTTEHLRMIETLLGPRPYQANLRRSTRFAISRLNSLLMKRHTMRRHQRREISKFLLLMLCWRPNERASVTELLSRPFPAT